MILDYTQKENMKSRTDNESNGNIQKVIFIVLLLFSLHFWSLLFLHQKFNVENIIVWLVCGYSFFIVFKKEGLQFKNAILLFFFGLLINIFPAFINLGQSPYRSILGYAFYYFIFLYFLLHYLNLNIKFLENVIIIFAIIYSVLFIIQTIVYPYPILGMDADIGRGTIRIRFLGSGFLILAYFLILNRYLINFKLINILLPIGFFTILLMEGYRTLIAGALLVSMFMFIKIVRFSIKYFVVLFITILLFVGLFQLEMPSRILGGFLNDSKSDIAKGDKYVRLVQMEFFFKRYPENISYFIFGGGMPAGDTIYKFNPELIGQNYNIVWVDIGLLGFYIVVGAFALVGLLWYTIKAIFIKMPQDKLYLNLYFLFFLIVSFTTEQIYRPGMFSVHAVGLYLIDKVLEGQSKPKDMTTPCETPISASG